MKEFSLMVACFLVIGSSMGQIDSASSEVKQAVKDAAKYLQSILGKDLYQKHILVDYENSTKHGLMLYSKDYHNPRYLRTDRCYELYFLLVQNDSFVVATISLLLDTAGKLVKDDHNIFRYSTPELIMGYKRFLTGDFRISYEKAIETGRKKGFKGFPYLQAETENRFITSNHQTFIKIKYLWSFYEIREDAGSAMLDINAETGSIEKEVSIPRMPK